MSTVNSKKGYTSVMEKIIKNAVSETSKVLETTIAELKAEVLRVKSENENLKIRCSQFEEVLKKRSVYRETGTSPEPYIIDKCDKAVQCDLFIHQAPIEEQDPVMFVIPNQNDQNDTEEPNLSENDIQESENSFRVIIDQESSNESCSFLKLTQFEHNACSQVDFDLSSNKTKPDEPHINHEYSTNEDMLVDAACLESEFDNMENKTFLEVQTQSSEQKTFTTVIVAQNNLHKEPEICPEVSGVETEEEFDISQNEVDIECQDRKESIEQTDLSFKKNIEVTKTEDVNGNKLISEVKDSEANLLSDLSPCHKCAKSPNVPKEAEEVTKVDEQIDQQNGLSSEMKADNATLGDTTNRSPDHFPVHCENTVFTDQTTTPSKDTEEFEATISVPESEQSCTEVDCEVQALPVEETPVTEARKSSKSRLTPEACLLRRQRCTSVTLEDAMLLLDAVNQHEYKPSPPEKFQTQNSHCVVHLSVETLQTLNIPEETEIVSLTGNVINNEENIPTVEPLTEEVIEADVSLANMDIEDQRNQETTSSTQPTVQSFDCNVPMLTPTKRAETVLVVDVDQTKMDIEGQQHDYKTLSSTSSPKLSTVEPAPADMTPMVTPSKGNEVTPADTSLEDQQLAPQTATPPPTALLSDKPTDQTLSIFTPTIQDEITQGMEENVCSAEIQGDYDTMSAASPTKSSDVELTAYSAAYEQSHIESEVKAPDISPPTAPVPLPSPPPNPLTQHTLLLKMPTNAGEQSRPILQTQTLSSAQLTAVVSAVRSMQNTTLTQDLSANTPSGKRALIAVPFSLQSVVKPHHKIIVIPRQCKVPFSQTVTKEKAIILKKNMFTPDPTTYTINSVCNATAPQEETSASNNLDFDKQAATVTELTQSPPENSALEIELLSSEPVKPSPCKNNVKVKLSRLPFPVSTVDSVSVTNMFSSPSSDISAPKIPKDSLPVKAPISPKDPSQFDAYPLKDKLTSPAGKIGPSATLHSKESEPIPPCPVQNLKPTNANQSTTIVRLSPIVSGDHSYPQLCMTKSQFLAKLEVTPIIQTPNKVETVGKDVQKTSLVERLRSHLKPRLQTVRTVQRTGLESSNLTIPDVPAIDAIDATSTAPKISGLNHEQLCEDSYLLDSHPHVEVDSAISPRVSSVTHKLSSDRQIKRKNSTASPKKTNLTPAKTVKKRRLKKNVASENESLPQNIPSSDSSNTLRIKILNSNALLSCVRRRQGNQNGVKKKSFLCKFCRKEFSKKMDIETHLQIHAGKKPFQCNICHTRFSRTMELSRHLRRHNAEKKYQCTFCGKAFIEYNNLKRHSYIHTGEKPFACPHCPKAFTQSGHMKSHIKNKHKGSEQ